MLKRSSKWIPKLSKWLPKNLLKNYDIPTLSEQFVRSCHGLADIQEFHDANPVDIANGIIKNVESGDIYEAKSKLDSLDLITIAREAKDVYYYDGNVKWLTAALKMAKEEKQSSKFISRIR